MSPLEFWIRFVVLAGSWGGWFALFNAAGVATPLVILLATLCAICLSAIDLLCIVAWGLVFGNDGDPW